MSGGAGDFARCQRLPLKLFAAAAVIASNSLGRCDPLIARRRHLTGETMMAEQDWMMAGLYLVGLVSTALAMSALSARAAKMRQTLARAARRSGE